MKEISKFLGNPAAFCLIWLAKPSSSGRRIKNLKKSVLMVEIAE